MRLLTNNPTKRAGLEGYGLSIVERVPLQSRVNEHNIRYLQTKKSKLGHLLDLDDRGGRRGARRRGWRVGRKAPEAPLEASGMAFGIVVAEFNAEITEALLDGARKCFAENGVTDSEIAVAWVPGAFELAIGAQMLLRSAPFEGIVALWAASSAAVRRTSSTSARRRPTGSNGSRWTPAYRSPSAC